uniref:Uncharacterized protein n=1 Tax=Knipowitschia caucasica TaxID=637954 RepID=A0AAV2LQT9_KNICA
MQSSPRAHASPSVSGSTPSSLNDLFIPPSPVPDRSRKSARLASQDAGSVRTFLAARGVVPGTLQAAILCTCVLKQKDTTGSDPLYLCAVAQGHYRQRSSVPVCCSTGTLQAAILCTCVLKHKDTTGSDPLYLCAVAQGHYRQRSSVPVC